MVATWERDVVVGFSQPKNNPFPILSWIIRAVEHTEYSHVYIRWYSGVAETDIAYHASGTQVHFLAKSIFDKKVTPIEEYKTSLTKDQYRALLKFCMQNAGVNYGLKGIFGILLAGIVVWWQKIWDQDYEVQNPFSSGETTQWCSKLVGTLLAVIGKIEPRDQKKLEVAGPLYINEIVRSHPNFERIL